jgi:protein-tyrosine-phosphatase
MTHQTNQDMPPRPVLFICNENCNRSQMAEAFARSYGAGQVEAYSAGCHPAEAVHPKAIAAMRELGYDMKQHYPKGLSDIPDIEYEVVVTVGCEDKCLDVKAKHHEHWRVPVPKDMPPDQFRAVRDQIAEQVKNLIARLADTRTGRRLCPQ